MRSRLTIFLILGIGLVFGLLVLRQVIRSRDLPRESMKDRKVRVLTYSSFVSSAGPGGAVLRKFEVDNEVKVDVTVATDAGLLLERMKLATVPFDVVIGLDQLLIEEARKQYQWRPLGIDKTNWHPEPAAFSDQNFIAFDWSPLTFVYRESQQSVPKSFEDLSKPEYKGQFTLQDPRSSTPGLQFFHWVKALKGAKTAEWLQNFKPNVQSVSPSWSFAYGLFEKEHTRFVFSYVTSLAFHWGKEKKRNYQILNFPEGHPMQIEVAAVPANCRECGLGETLVRLLVQEDVQKVIMERNFMFPVIKGLEAGTVFSELPRLKTINTETGKDLRDWDQVFKQ